MREPGREMTVLLLEDDQGVRNVLAEVLFGQNYKVFQAANPLAAVTICQHYTSALDALVADVSTLRDEPQAVLDAIKSWHPRIKVLLISGYDHASVSGAYEGLLAQSCFLEKPFSAALLTDTLETMFEIEESQRDSS